MLRLDSSLTLAAAGGAAISLEWAQVLMFGIHPLVWFGAFAGALLGVTHLPSQHSAGKPLATGIYTAVAVVAANALGAHFGLTYHVQGGIAVAIAFSPSRALSWFQTRFAPETPAAGRKDAAE